jgi:hypothetical protein
LERVSDKAHKNMMTIANLGVCFGPTLLRDEEETVAAIMDIKFANVVVEILVENWRLILLGEPPLNVPKRHSMDQPKLTVLPLSPNQMTTPPKSFSGSPPSRLVTPPTRPPPPYHPPPAPAIYNNGPKVMTRSPPGPHPQSMSPAAAAVAAASYAAAAAAAGNTSYNSATWERTLRMNSSSNLVVPPPLGSAPPPTSATSPQQQPQRHKPVRASLSSLSSSQVEQAQPPDEWYRSNKVSTAKTLQLHRQLSAGSGSFPGTCL